MNIQNLTKCLSVLAYLVIGVNAHATDGRSAIAEGAQLYNLNCARCHNARPASDFSARQWSVVMPHMREKAHLTRQETLAVESFLSGTLTADNLNEAVLGSLGQPSGEDLVQNLGCQGCHVIKGVGGNLGPNLTTVVDLRGTDFVRQKLLNPTFNNPASAMPKYPISEDQLDAIVAYLESLQIVTADAASE